MIERLITLLLLALLLGGCVTTSYVDLPGGETSRLPEMNARGVLFPAIVIMRSGERASAVGVRVASDSTLWLNSDGAVQQVSTSEIRGITFLRYSRGALHGVGLGFVLGGGISAAGALARVDDPWRAVNAALYGTIGALVGLAAGALTGLERGAREAYWFEPAPPERQVVPLVRGPGS